MKPELDRILSDLQAINGFNATPGRGITRVSFSEEDRKARSYLLAVLSQLGLSVRVDGAGNIRALYPGATELPPVMIGSHMDTVYQGGGFDGLAGVVCALEVLRVIIEQGRTLRRGVELVVFSEEEGSNFGITMFGSSVFDGRYTIPQLQEIRNAKGKSAYELMEEFGLPVQTIGQELLKQDQVYAMMELHIEQAGVLESEDRQVGIVENIAGLTVLRVRIEGQANHAGATPMHLRRDPMVAAASLILELEQEVKTNGKPSTVATVGKLFSEPNISNVIPQAVELYLDIRDAEEAGIDQVVRFVHQKVKELESRTGAAGEPLYKVTTEQIAQSSPIRLSRQVIEVLEQKASEAGLRFRNMNSGAVHDAAILAGKTQVGMIFIPSKEGRSHCPAEFSKAEDLLAGCQLLLAATVELADGI